MPTPAVSPSASTPTQSTATNSPTPSSSQLVPYKPTPSTVAPQVRYSDQKGKAPDATGPDFHYQCPIEDKSDSKKVLDRILGIEIPISARELLSLSPDVRKQMKELTTTKKVRAAAFIPTDIVSNFNYTLDTCNCHGGLVVAKESHALRSIVPIVDGTTAIECILDSGCQIVGMSLGSTLNPKNTVLMQSANGTVDRSLGIVQDLSFHFGSLELKLQVHVIDEPAYDILLGCPFDVLTESTVRNYKNEDQTITITDPNDPSRVATMQTRPRGPPWHHAQRKREDL